jgi:thymidylate kinase
MGRARPPSGLHPFTVALIGPDGAGKSTIAAKLEGALPFPAKSIYMGVNLAASRLMLPTTRFIVAVKRRRGARPEMVASPDQERVCPDHRTKRASVELKAAVRIANWIAEEWFRQAIAWYHLHRGRIVVFDRHFFADYYAADVARKTGWRPAASRLHGFVLDRLYPRPDLVLYLDAPAQLLLSRKSGPTPEWIERRRRDYLELASVMRNFFVIDASGPKDEVVRAVVDRIVDFHGGRGEAAGSRTLMVEQAERGTPK